MSSNNSSSCRPLGQRSITSSFFFLPSTERSKEEDIDIKLPKKTLNVSLSDFLNRKLHKTSTTPKTVQGKQRPFSLALGDLGTQKEINCGISEVVFEQFKRSKKEGEGCSGSCDITGEAGSFNIVSTQETRKRKNPLEGGDLANSTSKHVVVLGDDPKAKKKTVKEIFTINKRPRTFYNHYANGRGWWDDSMEGVDSEEVGCNEAWEGVGSTNLGGLDWH